MNWRLISHPVNWLVILSMVLLSGFAMVLIGGLLVPASGNPATSP